MNENQRRVITLDELKAMGLIESLCDIVYVTNSNGYKKYIEAVVITGLKKGILTYAMVTTDKSGNDVVSSISVDLSKNQLLKVDFKYDEIPVSDYPNYEKEAKEPKLKSKPEYVEPPLITVY